MERLVGRSAGEVVEMSFEAAHAAMRSGAARPALPESTMTERRAQPERIAPLPIPQIAPLPLPQKKGKR